MNYTEKYHLPQWVKEDRIMMEDFNQMCANLEEGITRAQETADGAAELPYATGTYTGDGEETRDIYLGFSPRFVIICANQSTDTNFYGNYSVLMGGLAIHSQILYMTDTGFRVLGGDTTKLFPRVNRSGVTYDYIAFR